MRESDSIRLLPLALVLLLTTSCDGRGPKQAASSEQHIVIASAPTGFSEQHLGRPHDQKFRLLPGPDGGSIFRKRDFRASPQGKLSLDVFKVVDNEALTAHASAWGLASASLSLTANRSYMARRLTLIHDVLELDESSKMFKTPQNAVYYPWRVYRGWSFEVICSGSSSKMTSSFKAQLLAAEGSIGTFSENASVDCEAVGHGIAIDKKNAIFAQDEADIEKRFKNGSPVPILVEWRRIPGRSGVKGEAPQPKAGCAGSEGCAPCDEWQFSQLAWKVPRTKPDSNAWDGDPSPPDVVISLGTMKGFHLTSTKKETYEVNWSFDAPFVVPADETVIVTATDKDAVFDDEMGTFKGQVPQFLDEGQWQIGYGPILKGRCIAPDDQEPNGEKAP